MTQGPLEPEGQQPARDPRVRARMIRIDRNGAAECRNSGFRIDRRLTQQVRAEEVFLIRLGLRHRRSGQQLGLFGLERNAERLDDGVGDVSVEPADLAERTLELAIPDLRAARGQQPRPHAHAIRFPVGSRGDEQR